jgi:hypothetical protein
MISIGWPSAACARSRNSAPFLAWRIVFVPTASTDDCGSSLSRWPKRSSATSARSIARSVSSRCSFRPAASRTGSRMRSSTWTRPPSSERATIM